MLGACGEHGRRRTPLPPPSATPSQVGGGGWGGGARFMGSFDSHPSAHWDHEPFFGRAAFHRRPDLLLPEWDAAERNPPGFTRNAHESLGGTRAPSQRCAIILTGCPRCFDY